MVQVAWVAVMLFAAACNDAASAVAPDVADVADTSGTDAGVESAESASETDAGATCPLDGTWRMEQAFCGDNDVTASLASAGGITSIVVVVTREPGAGDGTCRFEQTFTGASCLEVETRLAAVGPDGNLTQVSSPGITRCEPAACTFNAEDGACVLGDRAAAVAGSTARVVAGKLVTTSPPTAGFCQRFGLESRLVFAPD